jgi:glycosyltransferase involved in cell wall biosynthesis
LSLIAIDARLVGAESTGDSTYWTGLLYGLSRIGTSHEIILFSHTPKPSIPWLEAFQWVTIPARSQRFWSLLAFPIAARRHGATSIHTQYTLSPLAGRKGITTIHDVSFFIGPEWFKPKDRFLLQRSVPASATRAARIMAVSNTSKEEIERYIPSASAKVTVSPNACPPWIERSSRKPSHEGAYVLTVGTRWPRKNMSLAVEAMSLLPSDLPHKLLVTGKQGWGESDLGARGVATGYVSNEELGNLYSHADLYLAPSRHEGFGIPVLEAFRCGCPVLSSRGGALPEVVGDAGVIEPSWEPEDWAAAIQRLVNDKSKLEELRGKGFERERLFTWDDCARITEQVYSEVASL